MHETPAEERIVERDSAARLVAGWRSEGLRVVLTNGHFDLLHTGHVVYLAQARALGDVLVVGLNSDASTRALKGPPRPLVPASERAALLTALRVVDLVVIFEELTAESLVAALRPAVYVKGGDWDPAQHASEATPPDAARPEPPEAAVVRAYGAEVRYLPYLAGHSTSDLIRRIVARYADRA